MRDQDWITGERWPRCAATSHWTTWSRRRGRRRHRDRPGPDVTVAEETPEFLALAAGSDLVAGVVGWTDLTDPASPTAGDPARTAGGERLVGIRHQVQGEPDPQWLLRPDVLRGLRAVADAGLVYDLVVLPHQLPAAAQAAGAVPELHLRPRPPGQAAHRLRRTAALGRESEPGRPAQHRLQAVRDGHRGRLGLLDHGGPRALRRTVLDAFGPGRLMFGSDWPVCRLAAAYAEVVATARALTAGLSPAEQPEVFSGTAGRVYGLRPGACTPRPGRGVDTTHALTRRLSRPEHPKVFSGTARPTGSGPAHIPPRARSRHHPRPDPPPEPARAAGGLLRHRPPHGLRPSARTTPGEESTPPTP